MSNDNIGSEDVRRMIRDIVNVEGEDVQERREAIAATWANTFFGRGHSKHWEAHNDYRKERDVEQLMMMASMVASGLAKDGMKVSAGSIASRAIEIAREVLAQLRKDKKS